MKRNGVGVGGGVGGGNGERPRVLYLMSSLEMGGAERLTLNLFAYHAAQREPDIELYYLVMNDRTDPTLREALIGCGAQGEFWDRKQGSRKPSYYFALRAFMRERRINIIHAHTTGGKYWGMAMKMADRKLRLVYTVHSTFDVTRYTGAQRFFHRKMVDCNVAVSAACEAQCRAAGLGKTAMIYNGIPVGDYLVRGAVREAEAIPRLVTVSRIVPAVKGQDLTLEALALCRGRGFSFRIVFAGDISGPYEAAYQGLKQRARELALPDELIEFAGKRNVAADFLARFDGYICSSRKEGLGISNIEAMAAGLPVIACDSEGPAEIIKDGETGYLFRTGDASSLADTIMKVFAPSGSFRDRRRVAENARRAAAGFDVAHMYRSYRAMYEKALV
ncbi:MAG: glycosyltransferase [Clostridiales Family XIII bacterium]|jgi:glycosyltransferase involved in cell wall biosynthesis|nr:glycosyltransferase [Clostridiales Family XIII bacterium]